MTSIRPAAHAGDDVALVVHLDDTEPAEITRAQLHAARTNPDAAGHHPALLAYLAAVDASDDPVGPEFD